MLRRMLLTGLCVLFLSGSSLAFAADVYVTPKGKKYHTEDCRLIKNKQAEAMDEAEAVKEGYSPCGICLKDGSFVKNSESKSEKKQVQKAKK